MEAKVTYKKFDFQIAPKEPLILPSYKGSTLRGGFGHAFKRIVCAIKNQDCLSCLLKEKCVYSYIFETPPPSDTKIMRKYTSAPHPFIIEPPLEKRRGYKPGDKINFGLTLIGRAVEYLPYFVYSFSELGNIGIGRGKGKYELSKVKSGGRIIYHSKTKTLQPSKIKNLSLKPPLSRSNGADSSLLTLNFLTPTRIMYNKHLTLDLEFHIFIRNLLRRLSLLSYFHTDNGTLDWDFRGIIDKSEAVNVKKKNLKWHDWEKYSARQETKMNMGGFLGSITFEGHIKPFMSIIKAGEVLHVGKGSSLGLGKFEIIRG